MAESGEGKDPFFTLEKLKIASGLIELQARVQELKERLGAVEHNIDLNRHDAKYLTDRTNDAYKLLSELGKNFSDSLKQFDVALRGDGQGMVKGLFERIDEIENELKKADRKRMAVSIAIATSIVGSVVALIFEFFGKAIHHYLRFWVYAKGIHH